LLMSIHNAASGAKVSSLSSGARLKSNDRVADDEECCEENHQPVQLAITSGSHTQQNVGNEAERNSVRNTECERNKCDRDESGNVFEWIIPLDPRNVAHHERANDDERRGNRWIEREAGGVLITFAYHLRKRRKEEAKQHQSTSHNIRQAR